MPVGNIQHAPGKVGNAIHLTGSEYYQAPEGDLLDLSGDLSIEAWVQPLTLPTPPGSPAPIVAKYDNTGGIRNNLSYDLSVHGDGALQFGVTCGDNNMTLVTAPGVIMAGTPLTHVVATFSSRSPSLKLYANGAPLPGVISGEPCTTINVNDVPVTVGRRKDSTFHTFFTGVIDELSLYNRTLTPTEVAALHSAEALGKCRVISPVLADYVGSFGVGDVEGTACDAFKSPTRWCFNQHQGASHRGSDTLAWDANLSNDEELMQPVFPVNTGRVIQVQPESGFVKVRHGGPGARPWYSGYRHMEIGEPPIVTVGQYVGRSTALGRVSNRTTDPAGVAVHLHFAVYHRGRWPQSIDAGIEARVPADGDMDGVVDQADVCPAEQAITDADADGCPDALDQLPALAATVVEPAQAAFAKVLTRTARIAVEAFGRGDLAGARDSVRLFVALVERRLEQARLNERNGELLISFAQNVLASL